jgi:probable phosphoglycerate mutase
MSSAPALDKVAFWYLRHGQTDWNAADRCQGRTDIPLNPTGIAQAREAAALLRGRGINAIYASPLQRARVTAEIAGEVLGLPVVTDDALREVNFGAMEGQVMDQRFHDWVARKSTPEGGESFDALQARAVGAVNRLLTAPPPVLIVAHGAFFRALRAAMGIDPANRLPNAVPMFCEPPLDGTPVWRLMTV